MAEDVGTMTTNKEKIAAALETIRLYAGFDGGHHKQWVLDRVVRDLTGSEPKYKEWIEKWEDGEDGPQTYNWDHGTPP